MPSIVSVTSVLVLVLCCLFQSALSQSTLSLCYTLVPVSGTLYGNWSTQFSATFSVSPYTLPAGYAYTGGASAAYSSAYTVNSIVSGTRTFISAVGTKYVSTLSSSALLARGYVYAPSGITASVNNDNLIFVNPTTGAFTFSANGTAFTVTVASNPPGTPGLPGFPRTARFNMVQILSLTGTPGQLVETGFGPIAVDPSIGANGISAASSYAAISDYLGPVTTTTVSSITASTVTCLAPTNTVLSQNFINQGFCYILYPHEFSNGMFSIATSGILQTSPVAYPVPGSTDLSPNRMAYFLYGITNVSRTYIDQYGDKNVVSSGAFLQGINGDGGTDNLLYTATNSSDQYGGLVDGDGFTFTFYNGASYGGVQTPGDPTLAFAINFYYETNYREAAEPFHQDEEYSSPASSFTITPGATTAPTCVATPFTYAVKPPNYDTPVQYSFCSIIRANTTAGSGNTNGNYTIYTAGILSVTTTYFTSFATDDTQFYQIGQSLSGTRTYVPATGANSSVTIGTLLQPGGDGQNNNKLYNQTGGPAFDDGGWSYTVAAGTPILPGVTATGTSVIRLFYTNAWGEQALPSFQTETTSSALSTFAFQPIAAGVLQCGPTTSQAAGTTTTSLCLIFYSLPGNPDFPWSSAVQLTIQYNPTPVTTTLGNAVQIVSGTGTRTFTNKFGQSTTVNVTVLPAGTRSAGTSDNLLFVSSTLPFDANGITLQLSANVTLPGHGPSVTYSQLRYYAQTATLSSFTTGNVSATYITEDAASRIDPSGSAFLSSVANFRNQTLGGGNANIGAVKYATCQAPITFANGQRAPINPSFANGGKTVQYNYFVSDGVTYTITTNLTLTTDGAVANAVDALGNQYQNIIGLTGTRVYHYLPTNQVITSTCSGITDGAYQYADQRFYPFALLGSGAGIYTINTAPFVDYDGIEFNISPAAPAAGLAPGVGTQYTATSVYTESRELSPVLVDGYFSPSGGFTASGPTGVPVQSLQQQQYVRLTSS